MKYIGSFAERACSCSSTWRIGERSKAPGGGGTTGASVVGAAARACVLIMTLTAIITVLIARCITARASCANIEKVILHLEPISIGCTCHGSHARPFGFILCGLLDRKSTR